jgi:hypothetical protein
MPQPPTLEPGQEVVLYPNGGGYMIVTSGIIKDA